MHVLFFFKRYGDPRSLHVLTHSFPTRRSSDRYPVRNRRTPEQPSILRVCGSARTAAYPTSRPDQQESLMPHVTEKLHQDHEKVEQMFKKLQRSEEHTSELQSLMRNSYAVFCLKKKIIIKQ